MECLTGSYLLLPLKHDFKRVSKASAQEGHEQGFCVPGNCDTAPAKWFLLCFYEGLIKTH